MTNSNRGLDSGPTRDERFRYRSDRRRRHLLALIRARSPNGVQIDELATHLAAFETGRAPIEVDDADRDRALIELHHCHLPALEDAGVIRRPSDGLVVAESSDTVIAVPDLVAGRTP